MSEPAPPHLLLAMERIAAIADDMRDVKVNMGRLAEAVAKMAIVEERQLADRQSIARAFAEIDKVTIRLAALEQSQPIQKQSSDWVQKAVGVAVAAAIGASGISAIRTSLETKAGSAQVAKP